MAKAQNSLPPEETRYPGVSITARDGAHYAITQRRDDGHTPTFTLWSVSEDGGYAKLKSSTDYDALGSLIFRSTGRDRQCRNQFTTTAP